MSDTEITNNPPVPTGVFRASGRSLIRCDLTYSSIGVDNLDGGARAVWFGIDGNFRCFRLERAEAAHLAKLLADDSAAAGR